MYGYTDTDVEVAKARALAGALRELGVSATFWHEPNGIPGAMVFLREPDDPITTSDETPGIFVCIENGDSYKLWNRDKTKQIGWRWSGQLTNFYEFDDDEPGDWLETGFEWIERTWLGDTETNIAHEIKRFMRLLRLPPA